MNIKRKEFSRMHLAKKVGKTWKKDDQENLPVPSSFEVLRPHLIIGYNTIFLKCWGSFGNQS